MKIQSKKTILTLNMTITHPLTANVYNLMDINIIPAIIPTG